MTLTVSVSGTVPNGSSGASIVDVSSGEYVKRINNGPSGSTTETFTLSSGTYYVIGGGGGGNSYGSFAAGYTVSISFSA